MPRKILDWKPNLPLVHFFTPTRYDKTGELGKARYKNHNLPILQFMYNGNKLEPLKCVITKKLGWVDFPCILTKEPKSRFDIDFNHIRQKQQGKAVAGNSLDKNGCDPSAVFRSKRLDEHPMLLLEFMAIMPISQEYHRYVTQDSALGHVTLKNFPKKYWPWVLRNKTNFNRFCRKYKIHNHITNLTYEWFIDHLSNINHPPLHKRIG